MQKEDISLLPLVQYLLCCERAIFVTSHGLQSSTIAKPYLLIEESLSTFSKISLEDI